MLQLAANALSSKGSPKAKMAAVRAKQAEAALVDLQAQEEGKAALKPAPAAAAPAAEEKAAKAAPAAEEKPAPAAAAVATEEKLAKAAPAAEEKPAEVAAEEKPAKAAPAAEEKPAPSEAKVPAPKMPSAESQGKSIAEACNNIITYKLS